jgi:hypothetical protein
VFGKRIWQGLSFFKRVTPMNSDLENTVDARNEGPVVTVDVESKIGHDVQSDSDVLVSLENYSFDDDMESAFSSLYYSDSSKSDRVDASKNTSSADAKRFDSADASVDDSDSADGFDSGDGAVSVNDTDITDNIGSSLTVYGADHADTVSDSSQDELAETG